MRTRDYDVAAERARRLTALSDQIFLFATTTMSLTAQDTSRLLTELARFEIAAADAMRASEDPRSALAAQASLDRERAIQDCLRDAYFRRDYSVVEEPLRAVAQNIGVALPDFASPDARWIAHEATRVLLDVSQERERRDRGEFSQPSPYFQRALGSGPIHAPDQHVQAEIPAALRGAFASTRHDEMQMNEDDMLFPRPAFIKPKSTSEASQDTTPKPGAIRASLKEHGVLSILSEDRIQLLEKGPSITISEAFSVFLELKTQGCHDNWETKQKPNKSVGQKWQKSSAGALRTGQKIWIDFLGDVPFSEVEEDAIDEAVAKMFDIPKHHGKGGFYRPVNGYVDLIERARAKEEEDMNAVERTLRDEGCDDDTFIEDRRREKAIPTMRADTYMRHVRAPNKVAKMLLAFGVIDKNPFRHCTFTNDEERRLKKTEAKIARQRWDDRFFQLLETPVFQGKANGIDDPLFWIPLIADLQGARSEEAAQLGPDDFGKEDGIPFMHIRQAPGNNVKSESGDRKLPIHPALIDLGLLDVMEHAQAKGQTRIFPSLNRGKTKETFTENFTKAFGYYRRTHGVYWHGLDLHALRTTFHYQLMKNSCPGYIKRNLMGHEPLDEGEKSYAQDGIPLPTLLEHVAKVPFDVGRVVSPVRTKGLTATAIKAAQTGLRMVKAS
ncbi:Phage integrase family protein [Roseivivax sp. THAF197b]|nr:Phage integrase family protein [Roseivivax sp. THAF197b]